MPGTKRELLDAARDVLLDEGLAGFSMRKVSSRCGVSATAIYRHFDDKDSLLASVVSEGFGTFGGYLAVALTETDPLARFRRMGHQYFAFALEHSRYYQLIFMTHCDDLGFDRLDRATRERASGTFQMLVDRIIECQQAGRFSHGDARAQAAFAWSSYHGLVSLRLTGNLGVEGDAFAFLESAQLEGVISALGHESIWSKAPASLLPLPA